MNEKYHGVCDINIKPCMEV